MIVLDIPHLRLQAQQIAGTHFDSATELVSYMGALQAQDFYMVKWAIGIRLPNTKEEEIETLIEKGELLRTHLLRPTWHLVAAKDIHWLLELTAPHIIAAQKGRHKELGLTEGVLTKSQHVIEKAFKKAEQLTREELVEELEKAKIATNENRAAHLLFMSELNGLLCSGASKGQRSTYRLLEERVKKTAPLSKDEALTKLVQLYFTSRGPATVQDFMNWSSFALTEVKKAMEDLPSHIVSETVAGNTFWWSDKVSLTSKQKPSLYLLPAFDEYIIGYKDRSAVLDTVHHKTAVSNNGIFWPTIAWDGQVIGIWKRTIKKESVVIAPQFFQPPTAAIQKSMTKAVKYYGDFLGKSPEVVF